MNQIPPIKLDIKADLTKPATLLIEKFSSACGILYEGKKIVKKAEAEAKARLISAKADTEIEGLTNRAINRWSVEEVIKQINIEEIITKALPQISPDANPENIDIDWLFKFSNEAKMISDEEMKNLWSKILAGEVNEPGTFSKRALETLKTLTKREAELLVKVNNLKISCNEITFIFVGKDRKNLEKYNFSFKEQLHLTELGILQSDTTLAFNIYKRNCNSINYFDTGKYLIKAEKLKDTPDYNFSTLVFTKVGTEILELIPKKMEKKYFEAFCEELSSSQLEVEYTQIIEKESDGKWTIREPWLKFEK